MNGRKFELGKSDSSTLSKGHRFKKGGGKGPGGYPSTTGQKSGGNRTNGPRPGK